MATKNGNAFGPYRNDLFSEILLDQNNYIKNCFYYLLKKGYFPNLASVDHIGINLWIQDLCQIVKMAIWKLIRKGIYVDKLKQKKYARQIIYRKSYDEDKRLEKNLSIDNLFEEDDYEKC